MECPRPRVGLGVFVLHPDGAALCRTLLPRFLALGARPVITALGMTHRHLRAPRCAGQRILVGKRKGSDGHGEWALPGGHLEFGESFEECAAREVLEETGLHVRDAQHVATENVVIRERAYHYVVIFMRAVLSDPAQQPRNCEPDKCEVSFST